MKTLSRSDAPRALPRRLAVPTFGDQTHSKVFEDLGLTVLTLANLSDGQKVALADLWHDVQVERHHRAYMMKMQGLLLLLALLALALALLALALILWVK